MNYISTRGLSKAVTFSEAVEIGLAPDGGLYVPEILPDLSSHLEEWQQLSYTQLAHAFLRIFADDLDDRQLEALVEQAYAGFADPDVAPLRQLDTDLWVLELFHGPTLAFKDFALQVLGGLYAAQIKRLGLPVNVLGATSGDTGSAAMHGLLNKEGVKVFILYPEGRISPLQERQMTCTGASNVYPIAIEGSFDDAQAIVKELLGDTEFKEEHHLSAINSINIARILAQCVYYLYAWLRLPESVRNKVEFVVPTGNFGNVFAGWLLRRMTGGEFDLCVATNRNDILYQLFEQGVYSVGKVEPSLAPSMDIQVASNFERFLYYHLGQDGGEVRLAMQQLSKEGRWVWSGPKQAGLRASHTSDEEIIRQIGAVYDAYNYVCDPHTACGFAARKTGKPQVVLATAHPAKFPEAIQAAIGKEIVAPALEALKDKRSHNYLLPASAEAVRDFLQQHATL